MDDPKKFSFSLKLKETPFHLGEEVYTVSDMTGEGREEFEAFIAENRILDAAGKVIGVKNGGKGFAAALLSRTLRKSGTLVREDEFMKWPSGVVTALVEEAQNLCGMNTEAVKKAGNG